MFSSQVKCMADTSKIKVLTLQDWRRENSASPTAPKSDSSSPELITNCSEAHIKRIRFHADRLSPQVQFLLSRHGYRILAIREVSDFKSEWKTKRPEGYSSGTTYEHVGGLTMPGRKLVIIAEFEKRGSISCRIDYLDRFQSIFEHEIGHAVDFSLGISKMTEFMEAYAIDLAGLPKGVDGLLSYFLQEGQEGPRETVAEIFSSRGSLPIVPGHFEQFFKKSTAVVKRQLELAGIPLPTNRELGLLEETLSSWNVWAYQLTGEVFGKRDPKGKRRS